MKKILLITIVSISINSFGQSVTISPQTIDKQNSNSDDLKVTSYNKPPSIVGLRTNGTVQVKTRVLLDDLLMKIEGGGFDGNSFFNAGRINFKATQNWDFTNGAAITFETTANTDFTPKERMVINHDGRVGIGTPTPTAQLDVMRGTATDGTAIFRGTTHVSHFNYATDEHTLIRGGKNGSNVIINDGASLGNVGLGTSTPTKAFLVVDKKIGAVHAIFGENTSGVAIESNWPGISFNGYYNGGRKPLSNGFVGGMGMNPSTGLISIYNTAASGTAGNNVTTQDVITMDNFGKVGIGNSSPQAKLHLSQGNLRVDALAGSGNVGLYADNLGTISAALPVAFSVKSGTGLIPISTITQTVFPFDTENYDEGGFFNNVTYEFNAPVNGIYHFDSAVTFGIVNSANNLAIYNMSFLVDGGTGDAESTQDLKVGGYKTLNLSKDYKLNAGQKVKISVYQSSGATLNLLGQSDSYFTGHLVTRL